MDLQLGGNEMEYRIVENTCEMDRPDRFSVFKGRVWVKSCMTIEQARALKSWLEKREENKNEKI